MFSETLELVHPRPQVLTDIFWDRITPLKVDAPKPLDDQLPTNRERDDPSEWIKNCGDYAEGVAFGNRRGVKSGPRIGHHEVERVGIRVPGDSQDFEEPRRPCVEVLCTNTGRPEVVQNGGRARLPLSQIHAGPGECLASQVGEAHRILFGSVIAEEIVRIQARTQSLGLAAPSPEVFAHGGRQKGTRWSRASGNPHHLESPYFRVVRTFPDKSKKGLVVWVDCYPHIGFGDVSRYGDPMQPEPEQSGNKLRIQVRSL